jgi:uncharacterized protein (TIGR03790 family)
MRWIVAAAALAVLTFAGPAPALGPQDVCVLYNKNAPTSKAIAEYYARRRGVPTANLIPLDVVDADEISRADYERKIVGPVRAALKDRRPPAKVLLTVYGMPLRVGAQVVSEADKAEIAKLKPQLEQAEAENQKLLQTVRVLKAEVERDKSSPLATTIPEKEEKQRVAQQKVAALQETERRLTHAESVASVDSELMLLWWDGYPTYRWIINPLYWQVPAAQRRAAPPVMMTARLDGPHPDIVKRLVDDALLAERTGLAGKVYVDARGIKYNPEADKSGTGYGGYDESFREAARLLEVGGKMDVTLEDSEELFQAGSCTGCALYCGWYALRNYRPCCKFVPGAVAWHLASLEALSLRTPDKQWAGNLLRDGAAVTIGPVYEPYTVGFPKPAEFFGFLVTGEYTLVECYARSLLLTSWQMTLVGDPLYNPYAKTPKLKSQDVLPSPFGAARLFGPG